MSVEIIAIIISAAGLLVTLGGGLFAAVAWIVKQINSLENKLDARIGGLRSELKTDIGEIRGELGELREDLNEVKVAVARLEGPGRRFYATAH